MKIGPAERKLGAACRQDGGWGVEVGRSMGVERRAQPVQRELAQGAGRLEGTDGGCRGSHGMHGLLRARGSS